MDDITEAEQEINTGGINNPDLDKDLKPGVTALKNPEQAWAVFSSLVGDSHDRNDINARVNKKFNGEPPITSLKEAWRSNVSMLFLSGVIGQIVPSLTSYIENCRFLTQAKLKDDSQDGQRKTELLREKFTSMIRQWRGFRAFYSSLCQEIVLTGYAFVIWSDEYDWRGRFYREDEAFVPDGTPPFSEYVQVLGVKQDFLIHELTSIIQDKEAAEAAKWKTDNTADAINKAIPYKDNEDPNNPRKWEDAVREGNLGMSHSSGAKVVETGHLFAIETGAPEKDGNVPVTHIILNRNDKHDDLLWHEKRFKSMSDVVCLFTLEPGNNKFYGSKGIGRTLANYAHLIDIIVNRAVDNLFLSGLIVVQWGGAKGLPNPKVKTPFLAIHPDAKFDQKPKLQANAEEFVVAVNFIVDRAQQAVGAYLAAALNPAEEGKERTAREATIDYQRELQSKAAHIARFAGQWGDYVSNTQRKACDADTTDSQAKEFQEWALGDKEKNIPAVVTREELTEWAESAAAEVLQDLTQAENQAKIGIADAVMGNPMVDQVKSLRMKITAMIGGNPSVANDLILPNAIDPNEEIEQFRQQQIETEAILNGASMPVSGRDNDEVHLKQIMPDMAKGMQALVQNPESALDKPETLDHLHAGGVHAAAHVQGMKNKGAPPEKTAPYEQALDQGDKVLTKFAEQLQKMKAAKEQQAQEAQQQPPVEPDQPMGSTEKPLPFTEKVAVAWIGQFEQLDTNSRARLEKLTGLIDSTEELSKNVDTALDNAKEVVNSSVPILATPPEPLPPNPAPSPEPPINEAVPQESMAA